MYNTVAVFLPLYMELNCFMLYKQAPILMLMLVFAKFMCCLGV